MPSDPQKAPNLGVEGKLGILILMILLVGEVFWAARGTNTEKADFSLTYVGATVLQRGQSARLYDPSFQIKVRDSMFKDANPLLFEHPPVEALLLSPLARLPYRTAYLLWGLLNAGILLLVVIHLRPHLQWPEQDLGYVFLWPLFAPLGVALFQGQPSLIALAGFAAGFVQLKKKRDFYAGVVFGLALFRFHLALPFALIFLLRRKWKFIGGFACSTAIFGTLSLLAVGPSGIAQYVRLLGAIGTNPQDQSYGSALDMGSIYGFFYALAGERIGHKALVAAAAVFSLALLSYVAKQWNEAETQPSSDLAFAGAIAASLVVAAHMFTHDFSPLILGMLTAGTAFFGKGWGMRPRFLGITGRATLILLWSFPLYFVLVAIHDLFLLCPILLLFTFTALFQAKYLKSYARPASALATAG